MRVRPRRVRDVVGRCRVTHEAHPLVAVLLVLGRAEADVGVELS